MNKIQKKKKERETSKKRKEKKIGGMSMGNSSKETKPKRSFENYV